MSKMKVLYAIQGTGNGHVSRAREVIPILLSKPIELDILISGTQVDVTLPHPIKYRLYGMSFIFGKKGGVDLWRSLLALKPLRLLKEMYRLPTTDYDLIINDFEPVSAWAAKFKKVPCISLSHQAAVLTNNAPKAAKSNIFSAALLKFYAPAEVHFGLHFKKYNKSTFCPIIRQEIRSQEPTTQNYYTVYLPAVKDEIIIKVLEKIEKVQWQVFSKHNTQKITHKNVHVEPITNSTYIKSLCHCTGLLCGGGFEAPAEALFLQKKLMVAPMKYQYEQQCNAAALANMGVPVLSAFNKSQVERIKKWTATAQHIPVNFPDETEKIVDQIVAKVNTDTTP